MRQVIVELFGIPIYGYGLMLTITLLVCTWWGSRRAEKLGVPPDKIQNMALFLFFTGILGARLTYVLQYHVPLADFYKIWEGGLVLYGSLIAAFIAYWGFYYVVLRHFRVSTWQLADAMAPCIALGIALGRVGCLLNGCCFGHVAPDDAPGVRFPILSFPGREEMVVRYGYQTSTGFTLAPRPLGDPRTIVDQVEPGSAADLAGLRPGDRVAAVNGLANSGVIQASVPSARVDALAEKLQGMGLAVERLEKLGDDTGIRVVVDKPEAWDGAGEAVERQTNYVNTSDRLTDLVRNTPRGVTSLTLTVERTDGTTATLPPFTPRTLRLHPTQIYETISMVLLVLLLVFFQPFRRHYGQVFVLLILCYAVHRFLNETIRDDTTPVALGMTLSQNISVCVFLGGIVLEFFLRLTQKRQSAPQPAA